MMDLAGTAVSAAEQQLLENPLVGGVILFTRNFTSIEQISALVEQIHAVRSPHLLVAVDHEGGRVQRFHEGFTRLPPANVFGRIFRENPGQAREYAEHAGWLLAAELRAIGVDFSFAPVLDLAHGVSGVIGDRAYHSKPEVVATLAYATMRGMLRAGMQAVGKHFPGHGGVAEDSHLALPVDHRDLDTLLHEDIVPFAKMIANDLSGIMPAHVVYDKVDNKPAGYSKVWLQKILRGRLNFQGVIFSDDLSMEAAGIAGSYGERAQQALAAGCDMVLVCNHPEGVAEVVDHLEGYTSPTSQMRLTRMHGKRAIPYKALHDSYEWQQTSSLIAGLDQSPWMELDV
jgi:beta-N-acetylhexosaminidase